MFILTNYSDVNSNLRALCKELTRKYAHVYATEAKDRIFLLTILVPPDRQGLGIGTSIIQELKRYATRVGKPIYLDMVPSLGKNRQLFKFYTNLGFVQIEGRPKYELVFQPTSSLGSSGLPKMPGKKLPQMGLKMARRARGTKSASQKNREKSIS